ncbi:MAG: type II toxin-antitoxin system VapC family toxin [Caldilineaceae bacterium SB0670_bin_27]|nr:type II toxin-antitoxin system VapC family toxin [Chloroflexota bacterium]MYF79875.1 type II toxin-antitoxin system VapC family toxin [Chloroflexota bacterium]MYJ79958.1 type II toxin-antitoxin system VapC family toxin [Caldilineaceae bacterium SB0670_bin_27]
MKTRNVTFVRRLTCDVIVPDINLLVYAYNDGADLHATAREWWEGLMRDDEPVGIPWAVATGFIRIMSNSRIVTSPLSPSDAAGHVRGWLGYPHVAMLNPGDSHLDYLHQNLSVPGTGPGLVPDAHIAALAMEADATLHTHDSDFARFSGLRWHDPIP